MAPSDANIYFSTLSTDAGNVVGNINTTLCRALKMSLNFQARNANGRCAVVGKTDGK